MLNKRCVIILYIFCILLCSVEEWAQGDDISNELPSFSASSVFVNSSVGSASKTIGISVPTGRGGIQPNLALSYSSSAQQGILGVGWTLDLGDIERSTKRGVPKYDDTDTFLFSEQELVFDASAGYYRSKIEGGFSKIEKLGNEWIVTDKSATKYYFGSTDDSKQYDPGQPSNVYKWFLSGVEDIHGNHMTVTYVKDNNQVYPQSIAYTGNRILGDTPFAEVQFVIEPRNTQHFTHSPGFLIKTLKRIGRIIVKAANVTQREYELIYSQSQATKRDLLVQLNQYASDGTNQLPSFTFAYSYMDKGFINETSSWSMPTDVMFSDISSGYTRDLGVRIADVNSDGYQDILIFRKDGGGGTRKVYINDRNKNWNFDVTWNLPEVCSDPFCTDFMSVQSGQMSIDLGLRLADLNGDGRTDFTLNTDGQWMDMCNLVNVDRTESYINMGNGWSANYTNWHLPPGSEIVEYFFLYCPQAHLLAGPAMKFWGAVFSDVNNDGYADIVKSADIMVGSTSQSYHGVFLNNLRTGNNGWSSDASWAPPTSEYTNLASGAQLVDLNGDGFPEIYYRKGGVSKTHINTGRNWQEETNSPWDNTFGLGDLSDGSTQFGDISGDGIEDMIIAKGGYGSGSRVLINTGYGWTQDDSWVTEDGNFVNLGTRLLDADADGMLDFMINYNGQPAQLYINKGMPADLLISMNNGFGGNTSIEYESSTHYTNTFLPFPFPVVKTITVSDAITGNSFRSAYEYANGNWNAQDREFRGFGYVKVTDPEYNYSETEYLLEKFTKGRVLEQRSYDSSGNIYNKVRNSWNDSQEIAPGSKFVYLERKDNFVYDGDPNLNNGKRTAEEFYYQETSQFGNLTKTVQLGEVQIDTGADIAGDTRTIETQYVNNEVIHLIGLPSLTTVKDNGGALVRQTWFDYDGLSNGASPVNGLLTKKKDWAGADPTDDPVTQYQYDGYGNLTKTVDPKGYETAITYDSTYHIFPSETQNALSYKVINEYYGVNVSTVEVGLDGLWGQQKLTTDPNNQTGKQGYDALGCLIKTVSPLDSIEYPTTITEYTFSADHLKITARRRIKNGDPKTINTFQFIDGFGRIIQSKSPTAVAGRYAVSGRTTYNSRGLPEEKYLPFFSTDIVNAIESIDTTRPKARIEYDAMGRVKRTINPDGSFSDVVYNKWITETYDENGHRQDSVFDAYGRLIRKIVYAGADGRAGALVPGLYPDTGGYTEYAVTQYQYDSEGNLIKTIDAQGNETIITYNKLGQKIRMNDPDMGTWQYTYDLNGNLSTQTDAKGKVITFAYDQLNRLTNKTDGANLNVDYTYDNGIDPNSKGRLTDARNNIFNDTSFKYDAIGRENRSIKTINGSDHFVDRNYDDLNNLIDITYPDNEKVFYKHNDAGQIEKIGNDPSILGPQSFYRGEEGTEQFAYLISREVDLTQETFQNTKEEKSFLSTVGGWIERYVLGIKSAYAAAPSVVGLVGYWAFDEETGMTTVDSSGSGYNGTLINMEEIDHVGGKVVRALDFDGTNEYVDAGSPTGWSVGNAITVAAWVKIDTDKHGRIITKHGSSGDYGFMLARYLNNDNLEWRISTTGSNWIGGMTSPNSFIVGQWYHFVATYDGSMMRVYVNGQENTGGSFPLSASGNIRNSTAPLRIGRDNLNYFFDGLIDEVRVYDRVLLPSEVLDLYQFGTTLDTTAPSVPADVITVAVSISQIDVDWTASTDNVGVTGYKVYRNGVQVGTTTTTSYSDTGLNVGTTYTYTVGAYDAANNQSAQSTAVNGTTLSDTTAPSVPAGLSATAVSTSQIDLSWTGSTDNVGVTGYEIFRDGVQVGTSATTNYSDMGLVASTTYSYTVSAYDTANNQSVPSTAVNGTTLGGSVQIIIDDTAAERIGSWGGPSTAQPNYYATGYYWNGSKTNTQKMIWRPSIITAGNYAVYYWLPNGSSNRPTNAQYTVFYSGGSAVSYVNQQESGGSWKLLGTYAFAIGTSGYVEVDGTTNTALYTIGDAVKFVYVGGSVDTTSPSVPAGLSATAVSISQIDLIWTASTDNVGVTGYKVYRNGVQVGTTTTTSYSDTGLNVGTAYTYTVSAYDAANNQSAPSTAVNGATLSDTTAPSVPAGLSATAVSTSQIDLSWTGSTDNVGVTGYRIDVATDSGFNSLVTGYNNKEVGNMLTTSVTGLAASATYYVRVRAYDAANNQSLSSVPANGTTLTPAVVTYINNVEYNAAGQITKIEYGNNTTTDYEYDVNARLQRIHTYDNLLNDIQDLRYSYDPAGNIIRIQNMVTSKDQDFKYDELNRLIEAKGYYENQGSDFATKTYAYDKIGNITLKDDNVYTYGEGGAGPHAVTRTTGVGTSTTYTYDDNGNMHTKQVDGGGVTLYDYDTENRLITVKEGTTTIAGYEYDGDGGRTQKTVGGTITTFVGSLYEESGTRNTGYVFLGDMRVASITNGQVMYYHHDHLGGTNVLTDSTGVIKEEIEYKPFGEFARYNKLGNPEEVAWFYFTGKGLDDETGLYYYGARYYDPSLGRFITPDTIVPLPTNPQTFNRYSYAGNNPVSHFEDGHGFWKKLWNSFKGAFGSFAGGTTGATAGAFIGSMILPGVGTIVGAYIGASIGAGVGQSIQHGGNWGSNIGNAFISTAETFAVATAGFAVGGPPGAVAAVVGFNMGMTAAQGGGFEDIAISGIVTGAYAVAGAAYYKAVGGKVIQKGVEIHNALKTGSAQPLGTGNNTKGKSLDVNQGENASRQQAMKLKPNYDIEGKIVSYDLVPDDGLTVYRQGNFRAGNAIKGQQWAPENPLSTPNYAQKYGLPLENSGAPDWIIRGSIHNEYGIGSAPASYNNPANTGGAIEIRPYSPNDVKLDYFHMP